MDYLQGALFQVGVFCGDVFKAEKPKIEFDGRFNSGYLEVRQPTVLLVQASRQIGIHVC